MTQDASPYPWEIPSMEEAQRLANHKLRKRPFVGSGFVALQRGALGPTSNLDSTVQVLLQNLLQQNGVVIDAEAARASIGDRKFGSLAIRPHPLSKIPAETADDANESEILETAQSGETSLFLTILKNICDSGANTAVATKELFKTCCLAVRAGDVPGSMDAKEMVMAALQFLSSDCQMASEDLPSLPLIRPTHELADLERRTFSQHGEWKLEDDSFKAKVLRLEQIFTCTPSSWRWLKREFAAPRLSQKDEKNLFLKGLIPASAAAKKPPPQTASRKRKSPSDTATNASSSPLPPASSD